MAWNFHDELEQVKIDGLALKDLGLARKDRRVVREAVRQNGLALQFASVELRTDSGIVAEAVGKNGMALKFTGPSVRADRISVFDAVESAGMALRYADDTLKADWDVVTSAVITNGRAIRFASDALKNDEDVVVRAARSYPAALGLASASNRSNRGFVRAVVATNGKALKYASAKLRKDPSLKSLSREAFKRHRARRLVSDEVKSLFSKGLDKGYLTLPEIRQLAPSYVVSNHELFEIADICRKTFDIFPNEPSKEEREAGRFAVLGREFVRFLTDGLI